MKTSNLMLLLAVLLTPIFSFAQNDAGDEISDYERINLTVFIPEASVLTDMNIDESDYAYFEKTLTLRLQKILARNSNFSGSQHSPRFMVFPTLTLLDEEYTATAPTMVLVNVDLNLFIADYEDGTTYSTASIPLQGAGKSKEKAMRMALKGLKNSKDIKQALAQGRKRILQYYNDQCDYIMSKAEILTQTNNYNEAFNLLVQVPAACKNCYMRAIEKIPEYFALSNSYNCQESLKDAQLAWAGKKLTTEKTETGGSQSGKGEKNEIASGLKDKNPDNETNKKTYAVELKQTNNTLYTALVHLKEIHPSSPCYAETQLLVNEIKEYVGAQQYFQEVEMYQDEVDLKKMYAAAAAESAAAATIQARKQMNQTAVTIIK